jgi:hypothetical protein
VHQCVVPPWVQGTDGGGDDEFQSALGGGVLESSAGRKYREQLPPLESLPKCKNIVQACTRWVGGWRCRCRLQEATWSPVQPPALSVGYHTQHSAQGRQALPHLELQPTQPCLMIWAAMQGNGHLTCLDAIESRWSCCCCAGFLTTTSWPWPPLRPCWTRMTGGGGGCTPRMWISYYRCVLNRHPGLHAFYLVHTKCDVFECLWPLSVAGEPPYP